MIPKSLSEAICRKEANTLLDSFMVAVPDEIDLETMAWKRGRLRIEQGQLDTAEGRLVASETGGVIRVKDSIKNETRKRFIIAHEIGHYLLHKCRMINDTLKDLSTWQQGNKETEANIFAGELLMPGRLLEPRIRGLEPSLKGIDVLADEFKTSRLATAVQFITYTKEPCAFIVTIGQKMAWMRKSASFEFYIPLRAPHPYSAAGEILTGKNGNTNGMVSVPAGAWLEGFDPGGRDSICEDARSLSNYQIVMSLLWIRDELQCGAGDSK